MITITSKLMKIRDTLNKVGVDVHHYICSQTKSKYIVWAEDGENTSLDLDNSKDEQVITGTIDYFTMEEYDTVVDEIQNKLNQSKISFALNSVQYEEETQLIHYEWRFEI